MSKLLYQGHGSYRITTNNNTVIYVDPFLGNGYDIPGDIILVTHEHYDHNKIELVNKKEDTVIIRAKDVHPSPDEYLKINVKGIKIEAVEAYNKNHDRNLCVGFILRFDDLVVYASGDTSLTNDMQNKLINYNIDYALLPIDGIYNMDANEATICANYFKPKKAIPVHMKPMELFDINKANEFTYEGRLIVEAGKEIIL